jgi:diguanylate cyclase (GGDEF)-like protein
MGYNGRIFIVTINLVMILTVKFYGFFYYDITFSKLPLFAIVIIPISYLLGKQYDLVKYLSEKDSLTKIYNRRYVINTFPKLSVLVDKKAGKLSLFLMDIDQFKTINDTYGHEMGDRVLQQLTKILLANTKKSDIVARWAGDEFLIIAPFYDEENNNMILHRVNKELKKSFKELNIDVSVSIGFSEYPNCARTLDDLLNIADNNMYKVKSQHTFNKTSTAYL